MGPRLGRPQRREGGPRHQYGRPWPDVWGYLDLPGGRAAPHPGRYIYTPSPVRRGPAVDGGDGASIDLSIHTYIHIYIYIYIHAGTGGCTWTRDILLGDSSPPSCRRPSRHSPGCPSAPSWRRVGGRRRSRGAPPAPGDHSGPPPTGQYPGLPPPW